MAIAFRAAAAVSGVNSGNMSPALPAGHALNDILLLVSVQQDNVASTVAGYTLLSSVTNGANAVTKIFAKRDGGAESAPTVTHTAGSTSHSWIAAYSGVDSTLTVGTGAGSIIRDLQSTTGSGTGTLTVTSPALSGLVSGDMRINVNSQTGTDSSGGTSADWTPTASFTERADTGFSGTAGNTSELADFLSSASASTSASGNLTGYASTRFWIGHQLALSSDTGSAAGPVKKTFTPIPFLTGH